MRGLDGIPLHNEDLRSRETPQPVQDLAGAIAASDAVLIATPEYDYSIPGVLENAIDWISRLPAQPFEDKPLAIMGASVGRLGTARARYHLRQVFVLLDAMVPNRLEVMIGGVQNPVSDDGTLGDEDTSRRVAGLVEAWAAHARRPGGCAPRRRGRGRGQGAA